MPDLHQITQTLASEILDQRIHLYRQMMRSHPLFALAARAELPRSIAEEFAQWTAALDLSDAGNPPPNLTDAQTDGWNFATETLLPILIANMIPQADSIIAGDCKRIEALREAAIYTMASSQKSGEVLAGLDLGMRQSMDVPDALYAKALRIRRA